MNEKKTILVVDDEQDAVDYLTALFEDHGFETIVAMDGKEAVESARKNKPDLITLDLTMPEESGVRAMVELKGDNTTSGIPVIIITAVGDSMKGFMGRMKNFPKPEGFMSKPIDPTELIEMTKSILGS